MKRLKNWNGVIDPRGRDTNDTKADTNDTKADTNDTKVDTADTNEKAILNIIQNDSSVTQKYWKETRYFYRYGETDYEKSSKK